MAAACGELDAIAGSLWAARTDAELVSGVEELQRLRAKAAALEAELVAELDAREVPRRKLAWGSTGEWLAHTAGSSRRQGKRTVAHAKRLTGERSATLAGLWAGAVSAEQAGVILDAVQTLPVTGETRSRGEAFLLEQAAHLNTTDLHRAARHLAAVADPDRADRKAERALDREDRAAHLDRTLSIANDGAGGVRIRGRGSVEDAAWLRAALLPLSRPEPAVDPATCAEVPDPRDHGTRMWDALIELARHALDTDRPPTSHGMRPRVVVTVDAQTLHDHDHDDAGSAGTGAGVTEDGLEVSGSAVRRMACDCDLVRVLLDAHGCVLDVGRSQRLVTAPIWTALIARDRHCAFPGCTRPPVMCHAHHIRHWADGGPTSLDNLVLLCGHHHRTVHHTPWQVRLASDRRPEFRPPPKHGRPPPDWIRLRPRLE